MAVARLTSQLASWTLSAPALRPAFALTTVRHRRRAKHFDPKWKQFRAAKVINVKLPEDDAPDMDDPDSYRRYLRKLGMQPLRPWSEKPVYLSCTGGVVEPYVPPEGDGKLSIASRAGAKQKAVLIEKKSKSMMALRKIRSFEEDFTSDEFAKFAQDIYIKAHNYLAQNDEDKLRDVVTERCYPLMLHNVRRKTIRWKFIESLEPPRVVYARNVDIISKDNIFSQITVRLHTRQQLAVYDRFGRLIYGSEILAKDVLEYVVFEKHVSNVYGVWRVHDKIIPDWAPPREPGFPTYVKEEQDQGIEKAVVESDPPPAPMKSLESKEAT